ncbi:hypothetical protein [Flavobacterium alkalisoli]|uniref:hypothetical protein n=1 Tax=Flavobacterium alkalisoli TaxID=2602769 RepID=UPI003A8F7C45
MTIKEILNSNLWNVLSSLGTFAAAIATFLTIKKMSQQRKDSFRPKVLILNEDIILKDLWGELNPLELKYKDRFPEFKLINIGNGIAEDINYIVEVPYDELLNKIISYDKKSCYKIESLDDGRIKINGGGADFFLKNFSNIAGSKNLLINYTAMEDQIISIPMNVDFLQCLLIIIFLNTTKDSKQSVLNSLPKLKYKISYRDIEGNLYKSVYEQHILHESFKDTYKFIYKKIK